MGNCGGALNDCPAKEPLRIGGCNNVNQVRAAGRLAECRDDLWVAAECRDIVLHPAQSHDDVAYAQIRVAAADFEEPVNVHAIGERNQNAAVGSKMRSVKSLIVLCTANGTAPRHPNHDGKSAPRSGVARNPDIEAERTVAADHGAVGSGLKRKSSVFNAVERIGNPFHGLRGKKAPHRLIRIFHERYAKINLNAGIRLTHSSESSGRCICARAVIRMNISLIDCTAREER